MTAHTGDGVAAVALGQSDVARGAKSDLLAFQGPLVVFAGLGAFVAVFDFAPEAVRALAAQSFHEGVDDVVAQQQGGASLDVGNQVQDLCDLLGQNNRDESQALWGARRRKLSLPASAKLLAASALARRS